MATRRKPETKADTEPTLYVGARVILPGSSLVFEITRVSGDDTQVDLCLRGTLLERFRVPVADLKFV